jgi:hypothetical protein
MQRRLEFGLSELHDADFHGKLTFSQLVKEFPPLVKLQVLITDFMGAC